MKIKNKIVTLFAVLGLLTSCSDALDPTTPTYTVGEADNAIVLRAGIGEGGASVQTRAGAEDNHNATADGGGHTLFSTGTKARLRVDGMWKRTADGSANDIRKTTTITLGGASATQGNGTKHNSVTGYDPQLYWDDYGTADPHNASAGRAQGLTIYGAAVDGYKNGQTAALPSGLSSLNETPSNWQSLSWNVGSVSNNAINQKTGWSNYDLLTSNNVVYSSTESEDNAYKFKDRASGKLLEFTHAMTKVTVELTAGEGFDNNQFQGKPEVTLLNFNYMGTVNVEEKTSTPTAATITNISAHLAEVKETSSTASWTTAPSTWAKSHMTKYDALVFPGNSFTATIGTDANNTPTSNENILEINADGNIYEVTAAQLVKAIANGATGSQTKSLEQAKNYILKITINKTGIDKIEATVKNWVTVTAENEAPVINVATNYGDPTTGTNPITFNKDYTFLRSLNNGTTTDINHGYTDNRWMKYASSAYKMWDSTNGDEEQPLYWPDHSCHYFFRGVFPRLGTSGDGVPVMSTITDGGKTYDVIAVSNEKYNHVEDGGHCPTDLLIAYPHPYENVTDHYATKCRHDQEIKTNGICATEGKIVMNFEHAMSQVEVKLTTNTANGATNAVIFDENTMVEIIGGYSSGYILLKDGSANFHDKQTPDYPMNREHESGHTDYHKDYHDAIIPQSLVASDGTTPTLKFKITVKSANGTGDTNLDTYETVMGIKDIDVTVGGVKSKITKWEPGKKYIYTLNITKTGIVSTATIKNWEEVEASQDVWF